MKSTMRRVVGPSFVFMLAALLVLPCNLFAQHVVKPAEIQKDVAAASTAREKNLQKVDSFFSSEQAKNALKSARIDSGKLHKAVRALDEDELARLATRTEQLQQDFAAGALTNQQITYILIALATAVIIIVIVVA